MTVTAPPTAAHEPAGRVFRHTPPPDLPLFDVHVNAVPPGRSPASGGLYRQIDASGLDRLGVAGGCVSPPAMPSYRSANDATAAWAATRRGWVAVARCGGAGGPRPLTGLWQLRAAIEGRLRPREPDFATLDGFGAVKLMPHVDGLPSRPVLEDIGARRLPILVHAGEMCPSGWIVETLRRSVGSSPIILAHLGSWPCAAELLSTAVTLAESDRELYLATDGASIGNFVTYAAARVPERVLFASNTPMAAAATQWAHVAAAVADDATLERIAFRNAETLFGTVVTDVVAAGETGGRADG